ncbi:MAG: restriction endonuclease subunit S [Chloroflexi bacterium]|nr:restriction endonuclease subunit S [Chloroflexota bacterium]
MESISSGSQGSTMKHITRGELQRYQVEVPELEAEQRRIAEILSTLDEAIEQAEALIAKHQQIKAGLMHDLFTRGVTSDGHLRPNSLFGFSAGCDHYYHGHGGPMLCGAKEPH